MKKNSSWRLNFSILILVSMPLLPSCATHEETGALTGALAGAAVGSNIGKGSGRAVAIFFGTILGSELGRTFGHHMDRHDHLKVIDSLEYNRTRQQSSWINPDTGNAYKVFPTRTYQSTSGPCREFTVDANIAGKVQQLYGTACRQADGNWKVIN